MSRRSCRWCALARMLALMLPGAIAAKRPCIRFDSDEIGPQFVSPSARRPTSMSGSEVTIITSVIQIGMPK